MDNQLRDETQIPRTGTQALFTMPKKLLLDLFLISFGSILCAIAVNGIIIPKNFAAGGITGICLINQKFLPFINLSWIYLLFNIPLFILAWMSVGRRFFFYSILGLMAFTVTLKFVSVRFQPDDKILLSLLAGITFGAGTAIILRSSGSPGQRKKICILSLPRWKLDR